MSLTRKTVGAINQMMAVDGTTAVLDAIHGALAFTKTGGVGNTWPGDSSNFRTILGAQAPVIAQATDNLLSNEDASFEGNTVGWWAVGQNCTRAADATQGWHGTHSLQITSTGVAPQVYDDITAITSANTQYTASARFKGVVGKSYRLFFYDEVAASQYGVDVIADGTWQTATITKTFGAGSTLRRIYFISEDGVNGNVFYIDAIHLETGVVQTPFALDVRTACTMSIPTATIGLTAGQAMSIMCVVNTPWNGTAAGLHVMFANGTWGGTNAIFLLANAGYLELMTRDATGFSFETYGVIDAINWAANVNHVVIATMQGNVRQLYLDGVAMTLNTGAGVRESSLAANTFIGTIPTGIQLFNGAILPAIWGRAFSPAEAIAKSNPATWASVIDLPQITVTGLATGNAVEVRNTAGVLKGNAVESGGTATLTYTLD